MQQQQYPPQQGQWPAQPQTQQPSYPASMPPAQQYPPYPAAQPAQQPPYQPQTAAQPAQQPSSPTPAYPQQWAAAPQQQWPNAPAPVPQPSMSGPGPKPRKGLTPVKIAAIVLAVVILGVGGLLGYKFFAPKSGTANDSNPFATTTAGTSNTPGTSSTPSTGSGGPVVLATGSFIDTGSGDHGSGDVTVGKTADGKYVIHLEHLNVVPGPDLHVYLSTTANPSSADQVTNGGVDLGSLAANQGSVNVNVPADVGSNLNQYKSVVIYCKSFAVIFTVAPLTFQNA
jgi:hypothetical protein